VYLATYDDHLFHETFPFKNTIYGLSYLFSGLLAKAITKVVKKKHLKM